MINWKISTPIALLIFNRPDTTAKVFAEIAKMKPSKLLVVADGPRPDHPGEAEKCDTVRTIVEQIGWDCELLTNYSDVNLGCKQRVSSGLDWIFSEVEEAIILEDDCIPHPSFFRFCEELLHIYRNDERVMMISGDNFQPAQRTEYSYYFSRYTHVWGWASWRRAWKHYDVDMKIWPTIRDENWLKDILMNDRITARWNKTFEVLFQGHVDTWDIQWLFTCWVQSGLVILPNINLISNIGFGSDATHTTNSDSKLAQILTDSMSFPLQHPPFLIRDNHADEFTEKQQFNPTFWAKIQRIITKFKECAWGI